MRSRHERVWLNGDLGLMHDFKAVILSGPSDMGGQGDMVCLRFDEHIAERRAGGMRLNCGEHFFDIVGAGPLDAGGDHKDAGIGLGEDSRKAAVKAIASDGFQKGAIGFAWQRAEIAAYAVIALGGIADVLQLAFIEIAAQNGPDIGAEIAVSAAQFRIGAQERIGRFTDQIVEDEVGLLAFDFPDEMVDICVADGNGALTENFAASRIQHFAGEAVGFPAPDIVRTKQYGAIAETGYNEVDQRHKMLVGAGRRIYDAIAGFKTFIDAGIPEQRVALFDNGNDLLAAPGCGAADDVFNTLLRNQFFAQRRVTVGVAARVGNQWNEVERKFTIIDGLDRGHSSAIALITQFLIGTGVRKQNADRNVFFVALRHAKSQTQKPLRNF